MSKLTTQQVEQRMARAAETGNSKAFWKYYFELALRKLQEAAQ